MNGVHIVANFYNCKYDFTNEKQLLEQCKNIVVSAGLTVVGQASHQFEPHGFTFAILLAESHLSIHTWPEEKSLAFDIYTCNFFNDNTEKTHQVYQQIKELLQPEKIDLKEIAREDLKQ